MTAVDRDPQGVSVPRVGEERDRLASIRERLAAASPAPWATRFMYRLWTVARAGNNLIFNTTPEHDWADADLCANAPDDLAWLLARLDTLRGAPGAASGAATAVDPREVQLERALARAVHFLDFDVRAMLPNEHGECGINSGCAHAALEREQFEALDRAVDVARNAIFALPGSAAVAAPENSEGSGAVERVVRGPEPA